MDLTRSSINVMTVMWTILQVYMAQTGNISYNLNLVDAAGMDAAFQQVSTVAILILTHEIPVKKYVEMGGATPITGGTI